MMWWQEVEQISTRDLPVCPLNNSQFSDQTQDVYFELTRVNK